MLEELGGFFKKKSEQKPLGDNETFIGIIQVACEDADIKKQLVAILKLDAFNRKSVLNSWLASMQQANAPTEFVEAMSYLKDDGVAEIVLKIISKK
jgi:hypothetical protein